MSDEEFQEYLDGRYTQALRFYDCRARLNKLGYRVCSIYIIVASASLSPLIVTDDPLFKSVAGVFSATIVVVTALMSHFQFQENWLSYRSSWDALRREPHLHSARLGDYGTAIDRNALLVERVETLLSREGAEWLSRHVRKDAKEKGDR